MNPGRFTQALHQSFEDDATDDINIQGIER